MRGRELWIDRDRRIEFRERASIGFLAFRHGVRGAPAQIGIERRDIGRAADELGIGHRRRRVVVRAHHLGVDGRQHCARDFALHLKNIVHRAIEGLFPAAEAGLAVNQFGLDPEFLAGQAHVAIEQVRDSERARDVDRAGLAIAKGVRRHLSDHPQATIARQRAAHLG